MPVIIPKDVSLGISEEQVREILRKADANGDGFLSKKELQEALKKIGSRMAAWRAHRCLQYADTNHDGKIGKTEIDKVVSYILDRYADKPMKK